MGALSHEELPPDCDCLLFPFHSAIITINKLMRTAGECPLSIKTYFPVGAGSSEGCSRELKLGYIQFVAFRLGVAS